MACGNCCDSNDITLPEGQDGVGISSITLNGSNQFVINYTNGTSSTTSAVTITATSTNILHNDTVAQTETYSDNTTSALGTFTYTVPAATLSTNGSEIRATAWFSSAPTAGLKAIKYFIYINGNWYSASIPNGCYMVGDLVTHEVKFQLTITRVDNTTAFVSCQYETYQNNQLITNLTNADFEYNPAAAGAFNFTTTGIILAPYAFYDDGADGAGGGATLDITCSQFLVEYYKKA